MGKAAAKRNKTTTAEDSVQRGLTEFEPRSQFLDLALNMSWQLAIAVIAPVYLGVRLDAHFKSQPSLTIIGFFVAILLAAVIVKRMLMIVNGLTNADDKKPKGKKQ